MRKSVPRIPLRQADMAFGNATPELGKRELVLRELNQILESSFFRKAARSTQFLRYVVEYALDNSAPLKERTIGVELFERRRDYATGDDPVVRVQAAEVRRRLDQYYRALTTAPAAIRVQLPVGSYSPIFTEVPVESPLSPVPLGSSPPPDTGPAGRLRRLPGYRVVALICAILLAAGAVALALRGSRASRKGAIDEFWEPVFATPQPKIGRAHV